ncbi:MULTISPECIES: peptidase inhibitor family I36 protein [unclassified Streptomyces]|uniref:peptidase inhibitor family I36 protein n=1 Tax=unclassified Streptomyces TaxID=2593676 RepID=UPI002024E72A|nr:MULTISPECIES: peptidase inhibitor family I36 protein [unclassified Streptomyces]MCX4550108.1 peptidase inhibitor family I36 protein [Streptomyces sp. NBC_01500]WSC21605.1 peptidase inhibitor family I36 protein [Streptomyces sp. NBC_01766]
MNRIATLGLVSIAAAVSLCTGPTATAEVRSPTVHSPSASYNCRPGNFCIYSGWNGSGHYCHWTTRQKANTADDCPFIQKGEKVRSLWNGTGHRIQYYTNTNYNHRVGSTPAGHGGNLQGSYQIRSFKPQ